MSDDTSAPSRSLARLAGTSRGAPDGAELRRFDAPVGPIDGWIDGDLVRATGIRYARADRFGIPRPEPDHAEPFRATRWALASPQNYGPKGDELFGPLTRDLGADEHCQRLSITAPADAAPGAGLPVIVWIHGGTYLVGAGDSSLTDPADLVREQRVVVVTVTYRLGAFGYIGTDHRPANLGLLDQMQALRWVRRSIGAFGGDAANVTAMGESAGADAIAHILAAEPEEPLADRAILQSPPLGLRRGRDRMTRAVSKVVSALDADSAIDELLAVERPVQTAAMRFGLMGAMPFGVQYGHAPMPPEEEIDAAWESVAPRVPLLIGTMGTEFSLFTRQLGLVGRAGRSAMVDRRVLEPIESWGSRIVFGEPVDALAQKWSAAGGRAWRYEIPWSAPGNPFHSPHGLDVLLQFGNRHLWESAALLSGSTFEEYVRAGRALRAAWGAFARGEDPGAGEHGVIDIQRVRAQS